MLQTIQLQYENLFKFRVKYELFSKLGEQFHIAQKFCETSGYSLSTVGIVTTILTDCNRGVLRLYFFLISLMVSGNESLTFSID